MDGVPFTVPPVLSHAHRTLDKEVDKLYGYRDTGNEADRIAFLFEQYKNILDKDK